MFIFDLKKMSNLLYDQWDLGKEKSGVKGKTCAYIYLFEILSESEKIILKKHNNTLIGFAGYSKFNSKKYIIRKKFYKLLEIVFKKSPLIKNKQAIYDYYEAYNLIPKELENYFDGEVSILIVDKKYRGKGYGNELLSKVFQFAKQDDIKNIQISADESCNYKIYEKFGCKKICEVTIPVGEPRRSKKENYIYEKKLKEGE